MTTPREPFDAEEARAARLYGALPGGEPSAALDARILSQARAAVARTPARRRPWFVGAGLGTAAAAVFAAGIAWQLGVFRGDRAVAPSPAAEAPAEVVDRIDIEFMKQEEKKREAAEPPPAGETAASARPFPADAPREIAHGPQAAGQSVERAAESAPQPAMAPPAVPAAPAVAPPPPPPPVADAAPVQAEPAPALAEAVPAPADAATEENEFASGVSPQSQAAPADRAGADAAVTPTRPTGSSAAADGAQAPASEIAVTGSRLERAQRNDATLGAAGRDDAGQRQRAAKAALGRWEDDGRLAPDAWIARIRERVRAGDRQGAENSLRRFVLAHPDRAVPRELQRLLVE